MISRLLAEAASEKDAEEMSLLLHKEVNAFLDANPNLRKTVLYTRHDAAPVKRIRGKSRFHVLIKLMNTESAKAVTDFATDLADTRRSSVCDVYFELNPATMV